jgi:hypothetical protein
LSETAAAVGKVLVLVLVHRYRKVFRAMRRARMQR